MRVQTPKLNTKAETAGKKKCRSLSISLPRTKHTRARAGSVSAMAKNNKSCLDEVQRIFDKFDKNGDGKISCAELKNVLRALGSETSTEEVKRIMAEIDKNGDGYIDPREFAQFYCSGSNGDGQSDASRDLRDAFDLYDADKNGLISATELHSVLKGLGEKCSLSDCRRMIKSVDVDGDGNVNFEEFKKMMTQ